MTADNITSMFTNKNNSAAFMPYVCCGDPTIEFTEKLIKILVNEGADAIELGIPFSDPIADGKTIQAASMRALQNRMQPSMVFELITRLRKCSITIPIIVMTYYNIVYANGVERFVSDMKNAGADGLIVPDAPLEESDRLHAACEKDRIAFIYMITPNTSDERMNVITDRANGFLYAVSVIGITGARSNVADGAISFIMRAKKITTIPIVCGFGISQPEQARYFVNAGADGIIIGSEIINIYSRHMVEERFDEDKALEETACFAREMKRATTKDPKLST